MQKETDSMPSDTEEFVELAQVRLFTTGDILMRAGEFQRAGDFVIILLQGSVAVNKPQAGHMNAPEVVGEFGFLGAEQLQQQLEVAAVSSGMVAVVECDKLRQFLTNRPDFLVPMLQLFGRCAMSHAYGKRSGEVASPGSGTGKTVATAGTPQTKMMQATVMEVFYRKRLEKLTKQDTEKKEKLEAESRGAKASAHKWRTSALRLERDASVLKAENERLREENLKLPVVRTNLRSAQDEIEALNIKNEILEQKLLESSREYFTETIAKKDEILRAQIHRTTSLEDQHKSHVAMIEVRDEKARTSKAQIERLERELKWARDKQMSDAEKLAALSDQLTRRGGLTADGEIIRINEDDEHALRNKEESMAAREARVADLTAQAEQLKSKLDLVATDLTSQKRKAEVARRSSVRRLSSVGMHPGMHFGRMSTASLPVQSLVAGLQETTRELAMQAESLETQKEALRGVNTAVTIRAGRASQEVLVLQRKLALSEQLLLAMIDQMQRLQAAQDASSAAHDALQSSVLQEASLRRAAARVGGEGYTTLQTLRDGLKTLQRQRGLSDESANSIDALKDRVVDALASMDAAAPYSAAAAPPLVDQMLLLAQTEDAPPAQAGPPSSLFATELGASPTATTLPSVGRAGTQPSLGSPGGARRSSFGPGPGGGQWVARALARGTAAAECAGAGSPNVCSWVGAKGMASSKRSPGACNGGGCSPPGGFGNIRLPGNFSERGNWVRSSPDLTSGVQGSTTGSPAGPPSSAPRALKPVKHPGKAKHSPSAGMLLARGLVAE
jgi:hypothetical protein